MRVVNRMGAWLSLSLLIALLSSSELWAMSCHTVLGRAEPAFLSLEQVDEWAKQPLPEELFALPLQKGDEITRRFRANDRANSPIRTQAKKKGDLKSGDYYFLVVGLNEQVIFSTTDYIEWPDEYFIGIPSSYASVLQLWLKSEKKTSGSLAKHYPVHAIGKVQLSEKKNGALEIHSFSVEPFWFDPDAPLPSEEFVRSTFSRLLGRGAFAKPERPRVPWSERVAPSLDPLKRQELQSMGYSTDEIRRIAYFPKLVDAAIQRKNYRTAWPAYISDWEEYELPARFTRLLHAGATWSHEPPLQSMGIVDVQSPQWVEVYRGIRIGVEGSEEFNANHHFDQGDIDYVAPSAEWVSTYYMHRKQNNTMVTYRLPAFLLSFEKAYQGAGSIYHHALKPSHLKKFGVDDLNAFVVDVE